jgi:type IV secretory pathway VirB10-like protein
VSKKLQQKQQRREAEERRKAELRRAARRRNLITLGLAVVVAAGVVYLIVTQRNASNSPKASSAAYGVSASSANCSAVKSFKPQPAKHISLNATHPPYNSTPPTSGWHYPPPIAPIDPGYYPPSTPQAPEYVLHNLEHGEIAIWYKPTASQSMISDLQKAVNEQPTATVAVPYDQVPAPYNIAITAWAHVEYCGQVSKDAIDVFRKTFQGHGPEQVGIPTFAG